MTETIVNQQIEDTLCDSIDQIQSPGLYAGKTGVCIYLYHLGRLTNNEKYAKIADDILDDVFASLGKGQFPPDFDIGLLGIGWGIDHLLTNGFVEGDPDDVLSELDDRIYKSLFEQEIKGIDIHKGLLGYGFYLVARLQGRELTSLNDRSYILKQTLITVLNQMYHFVENKAEVFREPTRFEFFWNLPLTIAFLAKARSLSIYNSKIDEILKWISPVVLTTFPRSMSNRLSLKLSMQLLFKEVQIEGWESQISVLDNGIYISKLVEEFGNRQYSIINGLAGILLLRSISSIYSENDGKVFKKCRSQLEGMLFSDPLEEKQKPNPARLGLITGLAGASLMINLSNR